MTVEAGGGAGEADGCGADAASDGRGAGLTGREHEAATAVDADVALGDDELLRMRNFGRKSLDDMKERLALRGFIVPEDGAPVADEAQALAEPAATPAYRDCSERITGITDANERLETARREMAAAGSYQYVVLNDTVDHAVHEICQILLQSGA